MSSEPTSAHRPAYDSYVSMEQERGPLGEAFARQILSTATTAAQLPPRDRMDVLDLGSGYGHTALALARECRTVTGIEPAAELVESAARLAADSGLTNLTFRHGGVDTLDAVAAYDLIVLDNVYEHLPDQPDALRRIATALRVGGALYLLVPNKAWPIEAHYGLPGLSWLPLGLANRYLRRSGRGEDYTDASYAPTYFALRRALRARPELRHECVLPADLTATVAGAPWHYRVGARLLERFPSMWAISKALLVVAVKTAPSDLPHGGRGGSVG